MHFLVHLRVVSSKQMNNNAYNDSANSIKLRCHLFEF